MSSSPDLPLQILSISIALLSAGSIATLSLFSVPMLTSQPASRSLPQLRWLFSRGSHIFPPTAIVSSTGFLSLSYRALPPSLTSKSWTTTITQLLSGKSGYYTLAAALCLSIAPFTSLMIPTNFELIQINEEKGGSRSAKSAKERGGQKRSAEESTEGKGDVSQWADLSGPQGKTEESSREEDEKVGVLLERFGWLNWVRAGLMGGGGVVGLVGALV
ncbi:hypothetical protein T440DRAFT_472602 [Plenodomus tracheiphilus IPT5]|uniref:DUF1772-domain-containing protein n=1 Tax=Plenodomus tracheiphilus IPT5 TaxID=1408161 RepID=A0A6A7AQR5_9PLEO|nr:hypothetical protein T440DRAFT_472602 [Plenodomus tracheiphilus IPT5]